MWEAGDAAQCDLWFPPRRIGLENGTARLLPVLVITLAYSRFVLGRMIPTRSTEDLLLGMWRLIGPLGRVPRRLIWDNERGIGRGPNRSQGVPAFMGTLATRLVLLPPRDPESKGVVERCNGWFETSFMPGRDFASPADFNEQFTDWLTMANTRVVRTIGARPADRLEADKAAMPALPPVPPVVGWRSQVRLGRDYYVRIASNDYSVDPTAIGRVVDATADLDRVQVRLDGRLVAGCDASSSSPARGPRSTIWSATLPTTTRRSGSTPRGSHDDHREDARGVEAAAVPIRCVEGAPDPGVRRPAGRPGSGCRLVVRGLPGRRPGTGGVGP